MDDISIQDNRINEEEKVRQQELLEQFIIEYGLSGKPIINANNEYSFKEQFDYLFSEEKLTEFADSPEVLEELLIQKEKCEQFMEAYDTDRMPRDVYAIYDHVSMFLYNEYNVVTLNDVSDYYYKRAAKPAASARLAGDADCSGTVDVSDAVLTARFVAEDAGAKITDAGLQNADADGDGAVTADDITAIQRIISKQ